MSLWTFKKAFVFTKLFKGATMLALTKKFNNKFGKLRRDLGNEALRL